MAYTLAQSRIHLAREQFRQGLPVDEDNVRAAILESWQRSRKNGVLMDVADKTIISPEELEERIACRRSLFDTAIPFMEQLRDFTTGSGFLAILADEEGYVLKTMGDEEIIHLARQNGLVEGCNRAEAKLGTNGIGTPIVTGKPIQVFAEEHYYKLHHNWVCSGAPIFDSSDRAIGVFCLTGQSERVSYHTLGLAASASAAITQQLKMQRAHEELERIQERSKVIVETMPSGIMLVNRDLEIIQINMLAASLLMLPPAEVVGRNLRELLEKPDLAPHNIMQVLDEKSITLERGGTSLPFSFTLNKTNTDEYLISFVKTAVLHKQVNRIIGSDAYFSFDDIIGQSPTMRNAVSLARIAAGNNSTVLLTGESGTGKELFAQSIHNASSRRNGPFVALNCGGLPKSLIESELFGYASGSFTGARREGAAGKFELANGGTIFLDEIGDMPFETQANLLRFLQNREVTRIGSGRSLKLDVRIIAATNKDLIRAIEENAFRSDLYYRLNVFTISIPPLRERSTDIRLLADYFLRKYAGVTPRPVTGFTEEAYLALEQCPWRGNVREMENMVERAAYLASGRFIEPDCLHLHYGTENAAGYGHGHVFGHMGGVTGLGAGPGTGNGTGMPAGQYAAPPDHTSPLHGAHAAPFPGGEFESAPRDTESAAIKRAMAATNGNMKKAAALLGMSRRTLYRKVERLDMDPGELRTQVRRK